MNKKAILALLVSLILMMAAGVLELCMSRLLLDRSNREFLESSDKNFEQLVEKVRRGEIDNERMVEILRIGRKNGDLQRELHSQLSRFLRCFGWGTLVVGAMQLYVLIRIGFGKRDAEPIVAVKE